MYAKTEQNSLNHEKQMTQNFSCDDEVSITMYI